jgi:rhodanese-related sulfurtransferase
MSKETSDTLGNQKQTNYALNKSLNKSDFIKEVLNGLTPPPFYFPKNVVMNINGYDSIDNVMQRGTKAYSANEFEIIANETNSIILDTRSAESFAKGFIPNSINIGIDGSFAVWVGTLITDIKQSIILVIEPGREKEVITRLARVGYDSAIGYLKGGFETWINANKEIETIKSIHLNELSIAKKDINFNLIDVRKKSEYDSEHVIDAISAPLDYINDSMLLIDKTKTYYVHCAAGYRSMIFVSILKARGYNNLINVEGGFNAIKNSNQFAVTSYVTPTTLL